MDASLILRAFFVVGAFPLRWGTEAVVGVSAVPFGAVTFKRPWAVDALRPIPAGLLLFHAFVYITTSALWGLLESLGTGTVADSSSDGDAFSAIGAGAIRPATRQDAIAVFQLVGRLASAVWTVALQTLQERIPVESCWALAVVAARQVFAQGVQAACRLVPQLLALIFVSAFSCSLIPHIAVDANADAFAREFL